MPTLQQLNNRNSLFRQLIAQFYESYKVDEKDVKKKVIHEEKFLDDINKLKSTKFFTSNLKDKKIRTFQKRQETTNVDSTNSITVLSSPYVINNCDKLTVGSEAISIEGINIYEITQKSTVLFGREEKTPFIKFQIKGFDDKKIIELFGEYEGETLKAYKLDECRTGSLDNAVLNTKLSINTAYADLLEDLTKQNVLQGNINTLKNNLETELFVNILNVNIKDDETYTKDKAAKTIKLISKLPEDKIKALKEIDVEAIKKFDKDKLNKLLELIDKNQAQLQTSTNVVTALTQIHNAAIKEELEKVKKEKEKIERKKIDDEQKLKKELEEQKQKEEKNKREEVETKIFGKDQSIEMEVFNNKAKAEFAKNLNIVYQKFSQNQSTIEGKNFVLELDGSVTFDNSKFYDFLQSKLNSDDLEITTKVTTVKHEVVGIESISIQNSAVTQISNGTYVWKNLEQNKQNQPTKNHNKTEKKTQPKTDITVRTGLEYESPNIDAVLKAYLNYKGITPSQTSKATFGAVNNQNLDYKNKGKYKKFDSFNKDNPNKKRDFDFCDIFFCNDKVFSCIYPVTASYPKENLQFVFENTLWEIDNYLEENPLEKNKPIEILFPIQIPGHWILGRMTITNGKIESVIYDSMNGEKWDKNNPTNQLNNLQDAITKAFNKSDLRNFQKSVIQFKDNPNPTYIQQEVYCGGLVGRMERGIIENNDPYNWNNISDQNEEQKDSKNYQALEARQDDYSLVDRYYPDGLDQGEFGFNQLYAKQKVIISNQFNAPQSNSTSKAEEKFIRKIIVDPTLRTVFLLSLDSGEDFLNGINKKEHSFNLAYHEYEECLQQLASETPSDFNLNEDLVREFTKQYLLFLFNEYKKFGEIDIGLRSVIQEAVGNIDIKNDIQNLSSAFSTIESQLQWSAFNNLETKLTKLKEGTKQNNNDKELNLLKDQSSVFAELVSNNEDLKKKISILQNNIVLDLGKKNTQVKTIEKDPKPNSSTNFSDQTKKNKNQPTNPQKKEDFKVQVKELYQIYDQGYKPPEWSIDVVDDQNKENEKYLESVKIYCDEDADKDEVMRLAREREPVNIEMHRYYDENSLQKNFGYKTSAYQNIYSKTVKAPANIAIYTKTPVKWGGKETTANIINVIAPALDSKNQPDYEIFFDTKKYPITFRKDLYAQHMESVFNKIFQAAVDNNNKEIILSGFGLGFFSSLCGEEAAKDGYKTGLINSLKKFESNLLKSGIKISFNSREANDTFPDGIIRSLTKNLRGEKIIGGIDEIVFKQNIENRLYVNAWDPHSFVGNGNEGDVSLDGWWGRMTAMGFLCSPLTNQYLLKTDKIKFVTNSQKLEKDKDNLEQIVKNSEAMPGLEEIINEEFNQLKKGNNNLFKEKKIITIPSDNFLEIKAKDIIVGKLIRQEILDFQQYMLRNDVTAVNRANKREELGKIVAKNSERVSEFIQGSAQEDAPEFLRPIFENLFANNTTSVSTITITNNPNNYNKPEPKTEILPLPEIEFPTGNNEVNFSAMIKAFNKEESLIQGSFDKDDNRYTATKKNSGAEERVAAKKKLTINVPEDRSELVFATKRFNYNPETNAASKITRDVNFDSQTFNGKKYEITAFILHSGSLSSGHYTAYIKEIDGKWYCYDDSNRSEVSGKNLEDAKKQAYVVKYSVEGCLLPLNQKTGTTGGNNRCWMNASLAFLGSLTTISKDNLFSKEQNDKLRNEILGISQKRKEQPVINQIENSTKFQSLSNNNQKESQQDEVDALKEIVKKTVINPDYRSAFLIYLNEANDFFNEIGSENHKLYSKELKWNKSNTTSGETATGNEDPLIEKFTKEFTKQYLIFLFQKYDNCGFNFESGVIDVVLDQDFDSDNKDLIKIFQTVEQDIIQAKIISSLEKETNKNSDEFTKKLGAFSQLVYDSREKEEDGKDLKKRIEELQKTIPTYQKKENKNKENKNPETKSPSKFAAEIKNEPKHTSETDETGHVVNDNKKESEVEVNKKKEPVEKEFLTRKYENNQNFLHYFFDDAKNKKTSSGEEVTQPSSKEICEEIAKLYTSPATLNATDEAGNTPLHYATSSSKPNLELIDKLIEGGASMEIKNNKQEIPKLVPIINSQKSKPNPSAPYLGCGFKFDVLQDNSSREISMKIDEIFSPELPRFFIPPNKSFLGGEKLKSLAELEITEINAGGKTINLTKLFSDKPVNQAIQELVEILHDCGDVIFKTKDNKTFGCSRNAQNIFVTKKCSVPEVRDYFKNSGVTGIAYDPAEHGLTGTELDNFNKEIVKKEPPTGTPKKPISSQELKNNDLNKSI